MPFRLSCSAPLAKNESKEESEGDKDEPTGSHHHSLRHDPRRRIIINGFLKVSNLPLLFCGRTNSAFSSSGIISSTVAPSHTAGTGTYVRHLARSVPEREVAELVRLGCNTGVATSFSLLIILPVLNGLGALTGVRKRLGLRLRSRLRLRLGLAVARNNLGGLTRIFLEELEASENAR